MIRVNMSDVRTALACAVALLLVGAVTLAAASIGANATTAGFVYLILILGISIFGGLTAGLAASMAATACFNYFFLPPLHKWTIAD
ncbi:MAG TPA: DUF4118 domain-containing protein, partial [Thermoanaerobaculia bacterium]|nr:DUF4118 domain-containing protein [Thermoanaerobaculia bacterium]